MRRRGFILKITTGVAGAAIGSYFLVNAYEASKWKKHPLTYPNVLSSFCDEETIRQIGVSYRTAVPAENSRSKLVELLREEIHSQVPESSNLSVVVSELEIKVQEDFRQDKFMKINGWVLSKTEARQCALLSLS